MRNLVVYAALATATFFAFRLSNVFGAQQPAAQPSCPHGVKAPPQESSPASELATSDLDQLRANREAHPFQSADMESELQRLWDLSVPRTFQPEISDRIQLELESRLQAAKAWRASLIESGGDSQADNNQAWAAEAAQMDAELLIQKFLNAEYRVVDYDGLPLPLQAVATKRFMLASHFSPAARTLLLFQIDSEADVAVFAFKHMLRETATLASTR